MSYKQRRKLAAHVSRIATSLQIDKSIVLHFINIDLDRIYQEQVQAHDLHLSALATEIGKLTNTETTLQEEIHKKEARLRDASSRIKAMSASLDSKVAALADALQEVDRLQTKFSELDSSLAPALTTKRRLEYDVMMKSHQRRERNDKSAQLTRIMLAIFTLLAVAIAVALVWRLQ